MVRAQVGPLKFKNMQKIKSFFKSFISVMIVMLGVYLTTFYLKNDLSFTSVICGIIGFLILVPAVNKWDETLWGTNDGNEI